MRSRDCPCGLYRSPSSAARIHAAQLLEALKARLKASCVASVVDQPLISTSPATIASKQKRRGRHFELTSDPRIKRMVGRQSCSNSEGIFRTTLAPCRNTGGKEHAYCYDCSRQNTEILSKSRPRDEKPAVGYLPKTPRRSEVSAPPVGSTLRAGGRLAVWCRIFTALRDA